MSKSICYWCHCQCQCQCQILVSMSIALAINNCKQRKTTQHNTTHHWTVTNCVLSCHMPYTVPFCVALHCTVILLLLLLLLLWHYYLGSICCQWTPDSPQLPQLKKNTSGILTPHDPAWWADCRDERRDRTLWWKIECWQTAAGTPWWRLWQAVVWILYISPAFCQHSSSVCCCSSRIRSSPCSWRTFGQPSLRPRLLCWHLPACHRHKSAPSYLGFWWCPATLPCRAGTIVDQARNLVGRGKLNLRMPDSWPRNATCCVRSTR